MLARGRTAGQVIPAQPTTAARLFPRASLPGIPGFASPDVDKVEKLLESAIRGIADGVGLEIPGVSSGAGLPGFAEQSNGWDIGIPGVAQQDRPEPIVARAEVGGDSAATQVEQALPLGRS
ncbi:hypothetical protein ACWEO2_19330 [Nocardia sp. NPDC004278]